MLSKNARGTGLDTVFGKRLILDLQKVEKRINPCDKYLLYMRYEKCLLYSNARHEKPRYSILQSAHGLFGLLTQGTMCSRLKELMACWNIQGIWTWFRIADRELQHTSAHGRHSMLLAGHPVWCLHRGYKQIWLASCFTIWKSPLPWWRFLCSWGYN